MILTSIYFAVGGFCTGRWMADQDMSPDTWKGGLPGMLCVIAMAITAWPVFLAFSVPEYWRQFRTYFQLGAVYHLIFTNRFDGWGDAKCREQVFVAERWRSSDALNDRVWRYLLSQICLRNGCRYDDIKQALVEEGKLKNKTT